jgi:hypothetical protein
MTDRAYLIEIRDADCEEPPSAAVRDAEADLSERLNASVRSRRIDPASDTRWLEGLVPPSRVLIPLLFLMPAMYGAGLWLQGCRIHPATEATDILLEYL